MATSAFKSTTKRTTIGTASNVADDAGSSSRKATHRRSRSVSGFSGRFPAADSDELPAPRGRFVNTIRGSEFPEITLDDLASDFFPLKDAAETETDRGRPARRTSAVCPSTNESSGSASQRRVRSISRHRTPFSDGKDNRDNTSGDKRVSDTNVRRRRSVSVARYRFRDSESDFDHSQNSGRHANLKSFSSGIYQRSSFQEPSASSHRLLRRSLSQKDLLKPHDGYSSHSSALTDDEGRDARSNKSGVERIIRAVYAQKKTEHPAADRVETGLYDVMRKELRHAVKEIRTELEQVMINGKSSVVPSDDCLQSNSSDVLQAVSVIKRNYTAKLEQSEKRKQDLLAEMVAEEQRGRDLSQIVRELLPDPNTSVPEKAPHVRKRSNDRNKISKRLTEEAEKYFEDFIFNVEDTDISSFDGERSETSSTQVQSGEVETFQFPARSPPFPVEMDGVVLPWLQWETSNDISPLSCKNKPLLPVTTTSNLCDAAEESSVGAYKENNCLTSSCGSWSPGGDSHCVSSGLNVRNRFVEPGSYMSQSVVADRDGESWFDMDEYLDLERREDALSEVWRQRQRIKAGGLTLCCNSSQLLL